MEDRESWVQDHPQWHRKFKASLGGHTRLWPDFLSIAVINITTKSNLWMEGFTSYKFQSTVTEARTGTQGRNLEAGMDPKAWKGAADRLAPMACLACFLSNSPPPVQQWHCPQRAGPSHVNHYSENVPQTHLPANLMETLFPTEIPSSKILAWVTEK